MENSGILEEKARLESILERANVAEQHRDVLAPVIDNISWMRVKLDETRELMKNNQVVCDYNNGGNQKGTHESPLYKGFYNLWKAYLSGLATFTSYLPKEIEEEIQSEASDVLTQVMAMKKVKKA